MPISPARTAAFDVLLRVETRGAYASELLHSARTAELSAADRGLATELVMGVLRWQSVLDDRIAAASGRKLLKLDTEVLVALRMAAYQVGYLTKVPAHAAVSDSVELVKRARKRSAVPFVNAVLRKMAGGAQRTEPPKDDSTAELARAYAHPLWLVERWRAAYGAAAARAICEYDQALPPVSLRLSGDLEAVERELADEGVELAPGRLMAPARRVVRGDVTRTRAFTEGRVAVQDEASQLVAAMVGWGERILDCCAAPGGKTSSMAERNPGARVVAAELHPHRSATMRRLVRAKNVEIVTADAAALPLTGGFDRVLADVPCSGTGTLARNPEIKWRLRAEDLSDLHARQVRILEGAITQLAPGGKLVYSTCSLEREECEEVVERVLAADGRLRRLDCREELAGLERAGELAWGDPAALARDGYLRTLPGVHPGDGFFAAVLTR